MIYYLKENHVTSKIIGIDKKENQITNLCDKFYLTDFSNTKNIKNLSIEADYIYNFAANIGNMNYLKNYNSYEDDMININSLYFLNDNNLFFPSSSQVYSKAELCKKHKKITIPETLYGISKLNSEKFYINHSIAHNKNIKIARLFNIYGKYDYVSNDSRVVTALIKKVIEAKDKINILGNGRQKRHFLFAKDACEAIYLYLKNPSPNLLEIGSHDCITINKLVDILINISGKKLIKEFENTEEVDNIICNNKKFKKAIDWEEKTSLIDGLEITYKHVYDSIHRGD